MRRIGSRMAQSPGGRRVAATTSSPAATLNQAMLWTHVPYQEEAPAITSLAELDGAIEHLHYAIHRRYSTS